MRYTFRADARTMRKVHDKDGNGRGMNDRPQRSVDSRAVGRSGGRPSYRQIEVGTAVATIAE